MHDRMGANRKNRICWFHPTLKAGPAKQNESSPGAAGGGAGRALDSGPKLSSQSARLG